MKEMRTLMEGFKRGLKEEAETGIEVIGLPKITDECETGEIKLKYENTEYYIKFHNIDQYSGYDYKNWFIIDPEPSDDIAEKLYNFVYKEYNETGFNNEKYNSFKPKLIAWNWHKERYGKSADYWNDLWI